jgi:phage/plasmid primase-like uncharacterized protein
MTTSAISARDLADRLNLKRHPRSWRGRCPACDYAGSTFTIRADRIGRPRLYCANGCAPDVLNDVVRRATGRELSRHRDASETDAEARAMKIARAQALWSSSVPAAGTPAAVYIAARALPSLAVSAALGYRGDTPHPEGGKYPAMIALVHAVDGTPTAVHRTYLAPDGSKKAAVEPAKASLGPVWGGAIRLHLAAPEIVIAEGIETAGAAGVLLGLPAWAAISAGNLGKGVALPPEIKSVVVAADPDRAGEQAAREAALRWRAEGRRMRIARPTGSGDFADLLLERHRHE